MKREKKKQKKQEKEWELSLEFMHAVSDDRAKAKAMLAEPPELTDAWRIGETAFFILLAEQAAGIAGPESVQKLSEADRKKEPYEKALVFEFMAAFLDDRAKAKAILAERPELRRMAEPALHDLAVDRLADVLGSESVQEGSEVERKKEQDEAALLREFMDAACDDHAKAKAMLAEHPELLNARRMGETALHFLAYGDHADVVEFLATIGFDVNTVSVDGETPLMNAAGLGHEKTVAVLLALGADPNVASTVWGTALAYALGALGPGYPRVAKLLLDAGAKPDYVTEFGETWRDHLPPHGERRRQMLSLLAGYGAKLSLRERLFIRGWSFFPE